MYLGIIKVKCLINEFNEDIFDKVYIEEELRKDALVFYDEIRSINLLDLGKNDKMIEVEIYLEGVWCLDKMYLKLLTEWMNIEVNNKFFELQYASKKIFN